MCYLLCLHTRKLVRYHPLRLISLLLDRLGSCALRFEYSFIILRNIQQLAWERMQDEQNIVNMVDNSRICDQCRRTLLLVCRAQPHPLLGFFSPEGRVFRVDMGGMLPQYTLVGHQVGGPNIVCRLRESELVSLEASQPRSDARQLISDSQRCGTLGMVIWGHES